MKETHFRLKLTLVAALVGGATGPIAPDGISAINRGVVVAACVVRAERFAALLFLAITVVTLDCVGVVDRSISIRATDGVAVLMRPPSIGGIEVGRG